MKQLYDASGLDRQKYPNLVIVGATASGKTTVAYQLARLIGFGVMDLDEHIERRAGRAVTQIFAEEGETAFRERETETLLAIQGILNHVIIPGGGALDREQNWELLRKLGPIIWLAAPQSEIIARLLRHPEEMSKRPLLAPIAELPQREAQHAALQQTLTELDVRRQPKYEQADIVFNTSFATSGTSAQFIKSLLLTRQGPSGAEN